MIWNIFIMLAVGLGFLALSCLIYRNISEYDRVERMWCRMLIIIVTAFNLMLFSIGVFLIIYEWLNILTA